jgi:hypothetical protein
MSHQPPLPESAVPRSPQRPRDCRAARQPAAAGDDNPAPKADSFGRAGRAGRIAAGAAIGSAAIAGALLFAGKIDAKTPKRMWDKVKPPGRVPQRFPASKGG